MLCAQLGNFDANLDGKKIPPYLHVEILICLVCLIISGMTITLSLVHTRTSVPW